MQLPSVINRLPWLAIENWRKRLCEPAPATHTPTLGLVLSCGGARGLAHIGVIQVLEEENIPISAIIGSSMGSYVGGLWAAGVSGQELEKLAAEIKDRKTLLRLIDPIYPPTSGFLRGYKVRKHLERTVGDMTIGQLKIPTMIVATNLDTVTGEILPPETSVAAAIHASSAIPGICAPVWLDGHPYIDGGAAQPLPVSLLKEHANVDAIIAVNVMPTTSDVHACAQGILPTAPEPITIWNRFYQGITRHMNPFANGNILDTFKRSLTSAQLRLIAAESAQADVLIHPFFCDSRWYDFENFHRYIDAGRKAAQEALPLIRMMLDKPIKTKPNHETVPLISPLGCRST